VCRPSNTSNKRTRYLTYNRIELHTLIDLLQGGQPGDGFESAPSSRKRTASPAPEDDDAGANGSPTKRIRTDDDERQPQIEVRCAPSQPTQHHLTNADLPFSSARALACLPVSWPLDSARQELRHL
jgi:hypothetical protein